MSSELLYTSAPQGLKGGSRGFTTVLCTAGMPPNLADKLESFSGYKHVYSPQDPLAEHNPVRYAYLKPSVGGRALTVVSRLAAYGVDYSGRSNKIAHHIVLETSERPGGGPAWLLSQSNLWKASWDGQCKTVPAGPRIPSGDVVASVCRRWEAVTGDAGWGGQLVTWLKQSTKPIWLIYEPTQGSHVLHLLVEALALLPETERWKYTFATYFSGLPGDVECRIRGVVSGSDEARLASARGHVIDLTRNAPLATSSIWIEAARTGILPSVTVAPPDIPGLPPDPDPVLGDWETAPNVTSPASASPWLEEPPPVGLSGLEQRDFSLEAGDYQLAPPPMPAAGAAKNRPPAIPRSRQNIDATDGSALRWALPAIAATLILLLFGGVGIFVYLKQQPLSGLQAKSKPDTPSAEQASSQATDEAIKPAAESLTAKTEAVTPEDNSQKPEKPSLEVTITGMGQEQRWTQASLPLRLSLMENQQGETGYELKHTGNLSAQINFSGDFLSVDDKGRIVIDKPQDYEGEEWKSGKTKTLELSISEGKEKQDIKIEVTLGNQKSNIQAREVEIDIVFASTNQARIELTDFYRNELVEVENFGVVLLENGRAVESVKGKYGTLKIEKTAISYQLGTGTSSSQNSLKDIFDYKISCAHEHPDSQNKIIVNITNSLQWLSTKVESVNELRFDRKEIAKLFEEAGIFEVFFEHDSVKIGQSAEYKITKTGPKFDITSKKDTILQGVGQLYIDHNNNSYINKVLLTDDSELKKNLQILLSESVTFCEKFKQGLDRDIEALVKEISNLEMLIIEGKGDIESSKTDKQKKESDRKSLVAVKEGFASITEEKKSHQEKQPKTLGELIAFDFEALLEDLIEKLKYDKENELLAKSVLDRCKNEILSEVNSAKKYISECSLVSKKKDSGNSQGVANPSTETAPPLPRLNEK